MTSLSGFTKPHLLFLISNSSTYSTKLYSPLGTSDHNLISVFCLIAFLYFSYCERLYITAAYSSQGREGGAVKIQALCEFTASKGITAAQIGIYVTNRKGKRHPIK